MFATSDELKVVLSGTEVPAHETFASRVRGHHLILRIAELLCASTSGTRSVGSPGEPRRPRADRGRRSGRPATCGRRRVFVPVVVGEILAGVDSRSQRPGCHRRRQRDGVVPGRGRLRHADADRGHARPAARPASAPRPRTGRAGGGRGRDRCAARWLGRGRADRDRPYRASMPSFWPRARRRSCCRRCRNESSTARRRWS